MRDHRCRVWLALVGIVYVSVAEAQTRTTIHSSPACADCAIALEGLLRVGSQQDSVFYSPDVVHVARDGRGLTYLGPRWRTRDREPLIDVYDATGRRVRSLVPTGSGPGEMRDVSLFVVTSHDTLVLFSTAQIGFVPTDGPLRRVVAKPPGQVLSAVVTGAGDLAIATPLAKGGVTRAVHVMQSSSGTWSRSFDEIRVEQGEDPEWARRRILAASGSDRVWSAHLNRYQVDLWELSGELTRTVVRDVPWFQPWAQYLVPEGRSARLQPLISGLAESGDGLLWVGILVPVRAVTPETFRMTATTFEEVYDTVIEIIDVRRNRLVATRRFGEIYRGPFPGNVFLRVFEDSIGVPYVDVLRGRLERK